jgi:hypothetical protein
MLADQPANRPPGTAAVTDKGLAGENTEAFFDRRAGQSAP